ncbi:MAG: hypothetical protein ACR2PX_03745 [Endozoicomonas sp.]|uniref:hypothetical protein n=1 Tax=Endozoicomonas sp. TaxID=1892382 RepID=UPI003D9BF368
MIQQFKIINDLSEVIKEYEGMLSRPTQRLSHPTLYRKRDVGRNEKILKGVRIKDWLFSEDRKWVLPHDQMGLSFSSTYKNLKQVHKLKSKHNPGKRFDIFWILEKADIPEGMEFKEDRNKKGHYFLTVNKQIHVDQLVSNLKSIAQRMSVIRDAS